LSALVWRIVLPTMAPGGSGEQWQEVDVVQQPVWFGEELRRRRLAVGLTLTGLAQLVHYSKGQLSKVERGLKPPSRELVRLCDVALEAEGALVALFPEKPVGPGSAGPAGEDEEVWLMPLPVDGQAWLQFMSRRQLIGVGAASVSGMHAGGPVISADADGSSIIGIYRSLYDQYRRLGQVTNARLLLPVLAAQVHALQELAVGATSRTRQGLLLLASRYAEYIGWLVQESGDDQAALGWTRRAVEFAAAGGDHHLTAYALVRHALVTLYREEAGETVELARRAQRSQAPLRIRGLAAQREAQGHALAGDYNACMRSLEQARVLLSHTSPDASAPVIGTTNLSDPAEMITGWCLYDLGRPGAAAEVIGRQLAQVPQQAVRARVRFGVRQALAYATAGEVEHACHLTDQFLDNAFALDSATVATDLRRLARTLSRHPRNVSVRELAPRLGPALRAGIA
jgi:transcriptional regulator with XRE-family HTH domain